MNTDKIYAEQLANEYAPKDTSKVTALRKLDRKAKLPATVFTYTFGIIAALIAGVGMCLSMKVIGGGIHHLLYVGVLSFCYNAGSDTRTEMASGKDKKRPAHCRHNVKQGCSEIYGRYEFSGRRWLSNFSE